MPIDMSSMFPPHVLRDYAFIADGERGALVGPRGDLVWMCAPRWHDDALFSSLLGGRSGYAVTPAEPRSVWGGRYEDGTLIWRGRWVTTTGIIECRDALAFPGDPDRAVILRRIIAVSGQAHVAVSLAPGAGFDQYRISKVSQHDGVWRASSGPLSLRWSGADGARFQPRHGFELELRIPEGAHHDLVLEVSEHLEGEPPDPDTTWSSTESAWAREVPSLETTIAADDARQSYAVMRGLTSQSGAMVAAATMALPERVEADRNYDYRYAWIRDQCYAGQAMASAGALPLLDDAVRFVSERLLADGDDLMPAYTVTGEPVPEERQIDLPGYPGGRNKAGNWVRDQFQLDNFGEILLLLAAAAKHDRLAPEQWRAGQVAVDAIARRWTEPDAGIWELEPRHWTHSRLTCAAGLRAFAGVAPPGPASQWSSLADVIVADTGRVAVHPRGSWQRTPQDSRVDSSLLLAAIRGALPSDDPRSVATVDAVRVDLGRNGYVYRYRHDGQPLSRAEGAFLLSGFHLAMAVHQQGAHTEAIQWFERGRAACGSPGLFTEEYDIEQRQLRGNIPQAFVHALLVESASRLAGPSGEPMT